jgi:ABC-type polysaccharide/polyol phosphate transport system ATPase subunit
VSSSIKLDNVDISFPIYGGAARSLKNRIVSGATGGRIGSDQRARTTIDALRDISLKVEHGERVALIGHNGAGKTTLLRVLAGIYPPQKGRMEVQGRIAPLFDIGLGTDPDATGYDNIRLRGLYLGLTRKQVADRIDEIAEFTELGPFLDMPMRTYSMGMQTRLSFAVSTSVDPEVLLLDEGIGAGDANFMVKADKRLRSFVDRAGILVLVSHSVSLLTKLCTRGIRLSHGEIVADGPLEKVLREAA